MRVQANSSTENNPEQTADTSSSRKIQLSGTTEYPRFPYHRSQKIYCMSSIVAPEEEGDNENEQDASRKGIDLVCVIDKSGSMRGDKIDHVKRTLAYLIDQLQEKDKIALVEYDTYVSTTLNLINLNDMGKTKSKNIVKSIQSGSSTNLSGGLLEGIQQLKQRKESTRNEVSSVLLFTDGLANQGLTKSHLIVEQMQKAMQSLPNTSVFCFGFGSDTDGDMLTQIARAGNGTYHYIETVDKIPLAFGDVIGGLCSVVAQNINLKVVPLQQNIQLQPLYTIYKWQQDQKGFEMKIGDIYSGESKDILFEVELPVLNAPNAAYEICRIELNYYNLLESEQSQQSFNMTIERDRQDIGPEQANYKLDVQRNRIETSAAIDKANNLANAGSLEQARKTINDTIQMIQSSISKDDEFCQSLVEDLKESLRHMQDYHQYRNQGSKILYTNLMSYQQQRSTVQADASSAGSAQKAFVNKKKRSMKSKFVGFK